MPEGYTHIRTARRAAALARLQPEHPAAFGCGANGPDILFCYRAWRSGEKRGENLPALGERLHNQNTGAFLRALVEHAVTPVQRSYALGFLSHYAADCVLHPYVVCVTGRGQAYDRPGGHGYFEIALDSYLHEQDGRGPAVPVDENTPLLTGAALAEVGALLQRAIREALGVTVSREALADTFWHTRALRRLFVSRLRVKYALFWLLEPAFGGRGAVTGHMTPARLAGTGKHPKGDLPWPWIDPFTGEVMRDDLPALLEKAEKRSAAYLLAAQGYWDGRLSPAHLAQLLGSENYLSGLPDAISDPGAVPARDHKTAPKQKKPAAAQVSAPVAASAAPDQPAPAEKAPRRTARKAAESDQPAPAEKAPRRTARKAAEADRPAPAEKAPRRTARKAADPDQSAPAEKAPRRTARKAAESDQPAPAEKAPRRTARKAAEPDQPATSE